MRKWGLPLTVVGVSGLGLLFLTARGRQGWRWSPDTLLNWSEVAQREMDRIQAALNRVAETLENAG